MSIQSLEVIFPYLQNLIAIFILSLVYENSISLSYIVCIQTSYCRSVDMDGTKLFFFFLRKKKSQSGSSVCWAFVWVV